MRTIPVYNARGGFEHGNACISPGNAADRGRTRRRRRQPDACGRRDDRGADDQGRRRRHVAGRALLEPGEAAEDRRRVDASQQRQPAALRAPAGGRARLCRLRARRTLHRPGRGDPRAGVARPRGRDQVAEGGARVHPDRAGRPQRRRIADGLLPEPGDDRAARALQGHAGRRSAGPERVHDDSRRRRRDPQRVGRGRLARPAPSRSVAGAGRRSVVDRSGARHVQPGERLSRAAGREQVFPRVRPAVPRGPEGA